MTAFANPATSAATGLRHPLVWLILALWFLAIAGLAARGTFMTDGSGVPIGLALATTLPPAAYLLAFVTLPGLRTWVAGLDLSLVVGLQTFRVIGVVFLLLWGLGKLPTVFALVAGLGDIAVGLFAIGTMLAVERQSVGWQGRVRRLVAFGLLDFVLAFGTAILSGRDFPLLMAGEPLPLLMQSLPMALIPIFGVPVFIILHLMAWQKQPR